MNAFGANLLTRVGTALIVLPALLAALLLGPPALGVSLVAAAVLLGALEFFRLLEARGLPPLRGAGLLATAVLFLAAARPGGWGAPFWPLAALLLFLVVLLPGREVTQIIPSAGGTLLGALYVGGLGGTMAGLRVLDPVEDGAWRMVLLLAIIMGSDTLAFFGGHLVGRHRLAPLLSPGKTVEGGAAGLLGGVLGALTVRRLGLPSLPLGHAVALGVTVALMGIVGDLDESLLKRWAGVKDSGTLFPGHGGMLDRLDSLLFGAPVLYYYFLYVR